MFTLQELKFFNMKRYLILIIFLILNSAFLIQNSFSQWVQQSVPVTSGQFFDMKFVNANTGFIAHSTNVLLKTTDAGYNWVVNKNGRMSSLSIVDSLCFYGAGYNNQYGKLYKTTNGGQSWDSLLSSYGYSFWKSYFFNRDTGLISSGNGVDNQVWRTTDGGQTKQLVTSNGGATQSSFFFMKEKINGEYYGYLYYPQDRYLYCTSNSGVNWQYRQFLPTNINSIFFINKDTGWASISYSTNYVMKTLDGGLNWTNQTVPYNVETNDIYFANSQKGWISCYQSQKIYATTNGGTNWGTQTLYGGASFILCFLDSITSWVQTSYNTLSHTTNGGGPITSAISNTTEIQNDFKLYQNYPNPFNPSTLIKYKINKPSITELKIYSLSGNEIIKIESGLKQTGYYEYSFTPKNLSSGVYIYKLEVFNLNNNLIYSESKRMIFIK